MKLKKQIINYMMIGLSMLAMTACGSDGGSSSCLSGVNDTDGDGFHDGIDFAPNDASIPGDFSTPEKILAHPSVKNILKLAKDNDVNIRTELGHNPPNLTGYYRMEDGGGGEATNGVVGESFSYYGSESRICTTTERYETYNSNFDPARGHLNTYIEKNAILRGNQNDYTYYELYTKTCKNKTHVYAVSIYSANLNSNGEIVNEKGVNTTLYKNGPASEDCNNVSVLYYDKRKRVNNLDELEYMCVDDKKAYVPGETWKNKDKESCTCTKDVEIECS